MGTTDMGKIFNTCGQKNTCCPGHFGHLELARPVYYYHFIDIVIKILKCICFRCSKLLLNKDSPMIHNILRKDNKNRWLSKGQTIYDETTEPLEFWTRFMGQMLIFRYG